MKRHNLLIALLQAIVRNMSNNQKVSVRSHYGYEIDEVRVMGHDRFLVVHTSDTLILGDLETAKLTEVTKIIVYFGMMKVLSLFFWLIWQTCMYFKGWEKNIMSVDRLKGQY